MNIHLLLWRAITSTSSEVSKWRFQLQKQSLRNKSHSSTKYCSFSLVRTQVAWSQAILIFSFHIVNYSIFIQSAVQNIFIVPCLKPNKYWDTQPYRIIIPFIVTNELDFSFLKLWRIPRGNFIEYRNKFHFLV